jgi:hypothetical protein
MKTTIGGDRLGSGNKESVSLKNYKRSTHDLSYLWRSSMASGTLVPFMSEIGLPGDSFDIDLNADVKTLPTVGPLFGSYKVQLDVFECPIRLYNGKLHMNMLNIGMDMSKIHLPQMRLKTKFEADEIDNDNAQINSSSIYSYLNMRGLARTHNGKDADIERDFNAVPYLSYWDVYKNYYSNKQQEIGVVIHQSDWTNEFTTQQVYLYKHATGGYQGWGLLGDCFNNLIQEDIQTNSPDIMLRWIVEWENASDEYGEPDVESMLIEFNGNTGTYLTALWDTIEVTWLNNDPSTGQKVITCTNYVGARGTNYTFEVTQNDVKNTQPEGTGFPQLEEFPLENIDVMREDILKAVSQASPFMISETSNAPYGLGLGCANPNEWETGYMRGSQEGLGIKTYQSDLLNNWISTEWIDGSNGVNEVSAVLIQQNQSGDDVIYMDALNMQEKVYNMLNRIAISGGSYDDWLDAVYTHERAKSVESPVYHGSLIKELGFEEVISNADVEDANGEQQPLGTLAGRGRLTQKNKGGKVKIKVHEPCYILGIVSITPRIDYSQGNKWDVNLKTMNDLHKPALDEIGYQDLVLDQAHWASTIFTVGQKGVKYTSGGKQPAWINYMTNLNQTRGNFADRNDSMFMTLNRRYEASATKGLIDFTTYIDPNKYNQIFAQTDISSQNFWTQIGVNIKARRKMSAKVIPNL